MRITWSGNSWLPKVAPMTPPTVTATAYQLIKSGICARGVWLPNTAEAEFIRLCPADLSLGYTGLIGKDTADHGARATLSVRF